MRILVADDEPIEREALRVLLQRHMPGAQVVGEAGTGVQAVEQAEALHPDVILMDIDMPGLSGLDALQEIRQRRPGARCVIVSAYDYFHFARQALRLGAVDYLLKPVKREQMLAVLGRLSQEISADRERRQEELLRKEHLRQLRPLAEAELAGLLIRGEAGAPRDALLQFMGLRLGAGLCMVLGLTDRSFPPGTTPAGREAMLNAPCAHLRAVAHSLCACVVGPVSEGQIPVVIELETPVEEYHTRIWSSDLGRRLRDQVKEQTGVRFRVGIGQPFAGLPGVPRSYGEGVAALRFEGVSDKVAHFGDLRGLEEPVEPGPAGAPAAGGEPAPLPPQWRPTPAVLRSVEQGRQYIQGHFAEDVTLERVAREVALTPYYYCKIFSRVAGETLVDYLTRVRVEEARRLLTGSGVSIKEACFAVGYNDPNYFSRVFKKVTGQTPTEFRSTGT